MVFTFSKAKRERAKLKICLTGSSGGGKAQPVDTIIPTPNGNRRLGDIKVGDYVFDKDGKPTEVLGVYLQGEKEVFRVTLRDGRSTLCNDEHLWSYYTSKGNLKTSTLREMIDKGITNENGEYEYLIPVSKEVEYKEKDFDITPYDFGSDLLNGESNEKYIPYEYKYSSVEQRYQLLQGLFGTNDNIKDLIPRFIYSTTSLILAKDIMEVLYSLGYSCSLSKDKNFSGNICYKVTNIGVTKDDRINICNIEDLGYTTEMVCIYVDNPLHLYLTNDYIVTHNTLSSLHLAYGMTNDWCKIAVIDSERGRALMYADRSELGIGEFLHCDLEPPYTVERYIEAMREAEKIVGEDGVIIIDSGSHCWKGEGGVLDQKERIAQQRGKTDFSAWNDAGKIQNRFIDTIMDLNCDVIVTLRSKTAYAQEVDPETGKTKVKKVGLEPEQRADFEYEMTIVLDLDKETHNATIIKDNTFLEAEGFYGRLTPSIGKKLREWVNGGAEPNILTCECCGKRIRTFAFDDGTTMSPQEIVDKSKETYGKALCMDCCFKASEEVENENQEENVEE